MSWHKLNFRNNGPVLSFTALLTKHANSEVQKPPSQLSFLLPSIIITVIITVTSNEP